jgi:hypothetical protein
MTAPTPIAVHRADGLVLFDDNSLVNVACWLDGSGDPCDAAAAVWCVVARPTDWLVIDLRDFEEITAH